MAKQYLHAVQMDDVNLLAPLVPSSKEEAHQTGYEQQPPKRWVIFVTMSVFMGYATLNSLQRKVKLVYGIPDNASTASVDFSDGVSCLYIGNLVFRLMHNILFAPLSPRGRVFVSFGSMMLSMSIIGFLIFIAQIPSLSLVYIAYGLGGMSIGTFESNLLSSISPLGHATKQWAVLGIPIGYNIISIGSFALFAAIPHDRMVDFSVYMFVLVNLVIGLAVFIVFIPYHDVQQNSQFVQNMKEYKQWVPRIYWNALSLLADMFCVALFSGVMMYIWDQNEVPLFGSESTTIISHNAFLAVYNACTFIGDTVSRRIVYRMGSTVHPTLYVITAAIGATMCLSKIAFLAWPGIFLIFFSNGSIYATTTKHIDTVVMKGHNLAALSAWLFTGDIGSVTGSLLLIHVKVWVGTVHCTVCGY